MFRNKRLVSVILILLGIIISPVFSIDLDDAANVWNFDDGKGMLVKDGAANGFDLIIKNAQWLEESDGQVVQFEAENSKTSSPTFA